MTTPRLGEQHRPLTTDEFTALQAFAKAHGRRWKHELNMTYWYNARIWDGAAHLGINAGNLLHSLRNEFGPTWLFDTLKLPKKEA